jgi:hypothetical protein
VGILDVAPASADEYEPDAFGSATPLLGFGVDPLARGGDPVKAFECFRTTPRPPDPVSGEVRFHSDVVRDSQELLNSFGVSVAAHYHASFLGGKLSLNASVSKTQFAFSESNHAAYVVGGSQQREPLLAILTNDSLTPTGRAFADLARDGGDIQLFFDACGREIVTQIQREHRFQLVARVEEVTQHESQTIAGQLKAAYTAYGAGGGLEAEAQRRWASITASSRVRIDFFSRSSGPGVDALAAIGGQPGNLAVVFDAVQSFLSSIEAANPATKSYVTQRVHPLLGTDDEPYGLPTERQAYLGSIYRDAGIVRLGYERLAGILEKWSRLEALLDPNAYVPNTPVERPSRQTFEAAKEQWFQAFFGLLEAGQACFFDESRCDPNAPDRPRVPESLPAKPIVVPLAVEPCDASTNRLRFEQYVDGTENRNAFYRIESKVRLLNRSPSDLARVVLRNASRDLAAPGACWSTARSDVAVGLAPEGVGSVLQVTSENCEKVGDGRLMTRDFSGLTHLEVVDIDGETTVPIYLMECELYQNIDVCEFVHYYDCDDSTVVKRTTPGYCDNSQGCDF